MWEITRQWIFFLTLTQGKQNTEKWLDCKILDHFIRNLWNQSLLKTQDNPSDFITVYMLINLVTLHMHLQPPTALTKSFPPVLHCKDSFAVSATEVSLGHCTANWRRGYQLSCSVRNSTTRLAVAYILNELI